MRNAFSRFVTWAGRDVRPTGCGRRCKGAPGVTGPHPGPAGSAKTKIRVTATSPLNRHRPWRLAPGRASVGTGPTRQWAPGPRGACYRASATVVTVGWRGVRASIGTGCARRFLPGPCGARHRDVRRLLPGRAVVRHWARTVVTGPARRLLPGPRVCWHCARATVGTGFSRAGIVVRRPGPVKRADSILPAECQPHEPSTLAARRISRWQPLAEWAAARAHTQR